jgi:SAM-dependent methyltransferase
VQAVIVSKRENMTRGLDVEKLRGVEIGALDRPIIERPPGNVIYVDHLDTEGLRRKYANDPNVDLSKLVEVDVVCHGRKLSEALEERVDYVVASHVIEHVPDLISWLEDLRALLKPGGEVRLVVPDRRFTFDYLRRETRAADVVAAWVQRARVPLPHEIFDHVFNVVKVDAGQAWSGPLDIARLERYHPDDQDCLSLALSAAGADHYHDVHCWVFTPRSLSGLFAELAGLGLLHFACADFVDTERNQLEFFLTLRESSDQAAIIESWRKMHESPLYELPDPRIEALAAQVKQLEAHIRDLEASVTGLRATIHSMTSSTSWQVTAPLRQLRERLLRYGSRR